ncbi:MAG: adenosylcobinamide-phosphate synthase CbiB [Thermodesulfobacteriota bacterium]
MVFLLAYCLDLILGDPEWLPHPVRLIGKVISQLETWARKIASKPRQLKILGVFMVALVVMGTYIFTSFALFLTAKIYWAWGLILAVYLAYTTLATKDLYIETRRVFEALQEGNLPQARQKLSLVVGRDTAHLNEPEIVRALLETIAENINDGVIAPLFYLGLGGPSLAMTYKAINTLDSMLGYKNEKFLHLGWASAKLDDWANFIPARISGIIIVLSAAFLGKPWREAYKIMGRDHKNHESPNSGWPESAMAGALGLQFGGVNYYFGKPSRKPFIGEQKRAYEINNVLEAWKILYLSSFFMFILLISILCWVKGFSFF